MEDVDVLPGRVNILNIKKGIFMDIIPFIHLSICK